MTGKPNIGKGAVNVGLPEPSSRHIGPMAQDFFAAFRLGNTDKGLSSVDTGGVALAAIQGLKQEKDTQISKLQGRLQEKDIQLSKLQAQLHQQGLKFQAQVHRQEERMMQLELALTELLRLQSSEARVSSVLN